MASSKQGEHCQSFNNIRSDDRPRHLPFQFYVHQGTRQFPRVCHPVSWGIHRLWLPAQIDCTRSNSIWFNAKKLGLLPFGA